MKLALHEATTRLTEAQARLDRLQKDADALEAQNILSRDTLPDEIEWLQATLAADSNEGGHLFQSDRGHHSNLMAASSVSSRGPVLVMS